MNNITVVLASKEKSLVDEFINDSNLTLEKIENDIFSKNIKSKNNFDLEDGDKE